MNPILPIQYFIPDVEARQWKDGRIYLYGSYDISGRTSYCSWEYRVFSSADLLHWQDHGESFRSAPPNASLDWTDAPLFAPDCIYYNGCYYLFDTHPVSTFQARAGSLAYGGVIDIHLDQPDGELIGTCRVPHTGGWQKWATVSCPIEGAKGVHAVYLVFKGTGDKFVIPKFDPERLFDLDSFWFVAGF